MGGLLIMTSPLDEVFAPYPTVLDMQQVAVLLGCTVGTAYELLRTREVPVGRKVGGRWVVYKVELQRWLEESGGGSIPAP